MASLDLALIRAGDRSTDAVLPAIQGVWRACELGRRAGSPWVVVWVRRQRDPVADAAALSKAVAAEVRVVAVQTVSSSFLYARLDGGATRRCVMFADGTWLDRQGAPEPWEQDALQDEREEDDDDVDGAPDPHRFVPALARHLELPDLTSPLGFDERRAHGPSTRLGRALDALLSVGRW